MPRGEWHMFVMFTEREYNKCKSRTWIKFVGDEDMSEKERRGNGIISYQQKPVPNYSRLLVYQIGKGVTSGACGHRYWAVSHSPRYQLEEARWVPLTTQVGNIFSAKREHCKCISKWLIKGNLVFLLLRIWTSLELLLLTEQRIRNWKSFSNNHSTCWHITIKSIGSMHFKWKVYNRKIKWNDFCNFLQVPVLQSILGDTK